MVKFIKFQNSEEQEQEFKRQREEEGLKIQQEKEEKENLIKEVKYLKAVLIEKGTITQEEINIKSISLEK